MSTVSKKAAKFLGLSTAFGEKVTEQPKTTLPVNQSVFVISSKETLLGFAFSLKEAQRLACSIVINKCSEINPDLVSNVFSTPYVLLNKITKQGYVYNTTICNVYTIKEVRQSPCALDAVMQMQPEMIDKIMETAESTETTVVISVKSSESSTAVIPNPPPLPSKPLIDENTIWITMPPTPPPMPLF